MIEIYTVKHKPTYKMMCCNPNISSLSSFKTLLVPTSSVVRLFVYIIFKVFRSEFYAVQALNKFPLKVPNL